MNENGHTAKFAVDVAGLLVMASSLAEWLPPIAAGLSAVWFTIRIYEWCRWVWRGRRPEEKP